MLLEQIVLIYGTRSNQNRYVSHARELIIEIVDFLQASPLRIKIGNIL